MLPSRLNLEDYPDSVYAKELRDRSFRHRFPGELEREYFDDHLRRIAPRARAWTALATLISLGFTIANWVDGGSFGTAFLAHLLVILPVSVAMAWLAWTPTLLRMYMAVTRILAPVLGIAVASVVAQSLGQGQGEELANLTLLLVASFFFMGLLFVPALVTGVAILLSFSISAAMSGVPPELHAASLLYLLIAAVIGATICREVEHAYRRRFLEQSLMGELIDRDGMTGLRNRRAFDEHLTRVWKQSLRSHSELSVMMADIDFFKSYNDRYGHQAGDVALRKVAGVIHEFSRRPLDIAARYGGEEFAVVIYDTSHSAVVDMAERLRKAVEALGIENLGSECSQVVTISIGVGIVHPEIDRTPQGLVQLADEALYRAKESGRNGFAVNSSVEYDRLVTGTYRNPGADRQRA